jgi:hypothetical protein
MARRTCWILTGWLLGSLAPAAEPLEMEHVIVYHQAGRFAGFPANCGAWSWGDELLVGFNQAYYKDRSAQDEHSYDPDLPHQRVQARTLDGGRSWTLEVVQSINGDGHPTTCPGGFDFRDKDFALCLRDAMMYLSNNRGRDWRGPFALPTVGEQLSCRTDYLVTSSSECLVFGSAKDPAARTDRAFTARICEGGRRFEFVAWMTDPLPGYALRSVMPSTIRRGDGILVTALRRRLEIGPKPHFNWIDVYQSRDDGHAWHFLSRVAYTDLGMKNGNPPSMVQLASGRLVVTYGWRSSPFGIRAKISDDGGRSWSRDLILRDDGLTPDLGYTRSLVRGDGKVVTIYYHNTAQRREQHIAATIWDPMRY